MRCSSGPLFTERLFGGSGLLSFFSESCFDGSQSPLQVLYSCLRGGSFALFLLECSVLRPFASALQFGSAARGGGILSARLCVRRRGCRPAFLPACFRVKQPL
jgi:hypothetical protein